ncbi:MAG: oxidoreductase [Bryobacteraceae bacterium]|nr:MAG: oxidoreductase [Bryobacteraceae bacterium]
MSTARVRLGVAGAGVFGRNHLRVIASCERAGLAAVYDPDTERARSAAAEYGGAVCGSLEELAARCDAAVVASPTTTHAEVACRLLEAGLDVLVEKPMAASEQEARRMIEAAARHGRILQVGHLERFNPAVEAARRILRLPLFFEVHRLSVFSPRSLDIDVVADLMIHDLDLVLSMTGEEPAEIRAAGIAVLSPKPDIANVRLEFPGGCIANLTASRVSTERVRKLRFFQPRQYVSVDYTKQECLAISVGEDRQVRFEPQPVVKGEPLRRQLESFLDCVTHRTRPAVDGEAGAAALRLARRIAERIVEHGRVVAERLRAASIWL